MIEPSVLRAWYTFDKLLNKHEKKIPLKTIVIVIARAWETIATYTDKYLRQVADIIIKTPDGRIDIEKLGELCPT